MGVEGARFTAAPTAAPAASGGCDQGRKVALVGQLFHHLGQHALTDVQTLCQVCAAVSTPTGKLLEDLLQHGLLPQSQEYAALEDHDRDEPR
ncbi:MAG: hypothetical protein RBT47_04805, partial [Anaerolineae bacterium]|nr:hypothetical protein [Anaerolineae bacterium]